MFGDNKTDLSQPILSSQRTFTLGKCFKLNTSIKNNSPSPILPLSCLASFSLFLFFFQKSYNTGSGRKLWNLKHPDLIGLADRMKSTVLTSRASGIVNGYTRALNRWREFASRWGIVAIFPAELLPVALYLQHISESTSSCSSVDAAFYEFKWVHETARL